MLIIEQWKNIKQYVQKKIFKQLMSERVSHPRIIQAANAAMYYNLG